MGVSGTKEWAATSENILYGCQHDCKYCYAKAMSPRHKKIDINKWADPMLRPNKLDRKFGKRKGTIMFPTTHDIHPDNLDESIEFLINLLEPGNDVLIVSKPHLNTITLLAASLHSYKDQILFRFTIGSAYNDVLKFWEPNAPFFEERVLSLKEVYDRGFKTSISCEPMLDNKIHHVVEAVEDYITDAVWLGKMNNASQRCKINGHGDEETMKRLSELENWQNDKNIMALYERYKDNPKIKWKESIKKVVGIELIEEKGLDI